MNSFGQYFRLTTFGESHGPGIGLVLDGCPPGLSLDLEALQAELARRRPGQSALVSQRKEEDVVEILSGLFEGKTTGAPLAMLIRNQDARSKDYSQWAKLFRPSHADYTYHLKYGPGRDYRGGGRSSARETACRVAAGAVAKQILRQLGLEVWAYTAEVGDLALDKPYTDLDLSLIESNPMRCPDLDMAARMEALVRQVRKEGDSIGGVIQALVKGCPPGWGAPTFDKLHARLAYAMLSIPACKGFDYGSGFAGTRLRGSQHNDLWLPGELPAQTATNHSGGIQGGISNGMDIYFRVAFKPVATLMQDQMSIDHEGQAALYQGRGRHDPCVLPRAVPIVEAMTALVLVDAWLESRALNHPVFY